MDGHMLDQVTSLARLDFSPPHRQPAAGRVVLATVASVAGSLAADAILVVIGQVLFPHTKGYAHFQFADYAKLTVIGVIIAGLAWPAVVRLTADPRWVYRILAVLVTVVLLLPDLYIWWTGQPGRAVLVLVAMHLAIALITYHVMVRIAPPRPSRPAA
jgi:Family of unknown function (DUF6069)